MLYFLKLGKIILIQIRLTEAVEFKLSFCFYLSDFSFNGSGEN